MQAVARYTIPVTTDAAGDATVYSTLLSGRLYTIHYVKDATAPYADTVDFTITADTTGETIWDEDNVTASATRAPRQPTHSTAGVAALYAAVGTAVNDYVALANDKIKIVVANGGDTKTGVFHFLIG